MGLFLPLLLLGFVQPLPQTASPFLNQPEKHVWQSVTDPASVTTSSPAKHDRDGAVCYTMRSYIFERRNGYAPELIGMTTCSPSKEVIQKHIRGKWRLISAN